MHQNEQKTVFSIGDAKNIGGKTFVEMEKSALCLLVAREVRLAWSTEHGLLLFSIIFSTSILYSPCMELAKKSACAIKDKETESGYLKQLKKIRWKIT